MPGATRHHADQTLHHASETAVTSQTKPSPCRPRRRFPSAPSTMSSTADSTTVHTGPAGRHAGCGSRADGSGGDLPVAGRRAAGRVDRAVRSARWAGRGNRPPEFLSAMRQAVEHRWFSGWSASQALQRCLPDGGASCTAPDGAGYPQLTRRQVVIGRQSLRSASCCSTRPLRVTHEPQDASALRGPSAAEGASGQDPAPIRGRGCRGGVDTVPAVTVGCAGPAVSGWSGPAGAALRPRSGTPTGRTG